ncbi:DUF6199 family natural product biosynthesis protein [Paenibacillus sp. HW567]|uniref:DUF6199 family natural product biosynthesis protein n=1 Tax=Paenibacillus sp. HW567 TaxID=1034769 RepID=UPI0003627E25|nr:DUF6199 family natural product biosynthesis protein [Paenibacillus sp. HW567]
MPNVISWIFTAFLVLWTAAAAYAAIRPYSFWKITQGWKAVKEPPRAYFVASAIGAAIFTAIGFALLLMPLVSSMLDK